MTPDQRGTKHDADRTRRTPSSGHRHGEQGETAEAGQDRNDQGGKRRTAAWAIAAVRSQFSELSGQELEQITGVEKGKDSTWTVGVEVVDVRMVPDTADIIVQYDVTVDEEGDIIGYRRVRRHLRGRADD